MPLCYSNNGLSMRAVAPGYVAQTGEVLFPDGAGLPNSTALAAAFPGYTAAATAAGAPAVLASKLANGIAITSTGTPALSGTYAYDTATQQQLAGIAATIGLLGTFPDGTTAGYAYPDLSGAPHAFPSIASFKAFYSAYVSLLQQMQTQGAILAAGGTPTWPSQAATIA